MSFAFGHSSREWLVDGIDFVVIKSLLMDDSVGTDRVLFGMGSVAERVVFVFIPALVGRQVLRLDVAF